MFRSSTTIFFVFSCNGGRTPSITITITIIDMFKSPRGKGPGKCISSKIDVGIKNG
jgi:hypothetical protein